MEDIRGKEEYLATKKRERIYFVFISYFIEWNLKN